MPKVPYPVLASLSPAPAPAPPADEALLPKFRIVSNLALLVLRTRGPITGLDSKSKAARLKPVPRETEGGSSRLGSSGAGRSMIEDSEIEDSDIEAESSNPISWSTSSLSWAVSWSGSGSGSGLGSSWNRNLEAIESYRPCPGRGLLP